MCERGVIVLKLGGSVLRNVEALHGAVAEIQRWRERRYGVVAVVSALKGETERLISHARHVGGDAGNDHATAALVATGELASAAMLSLALGRAGVRARVLDAATIGLRTSGPAGDAEPVDLDPRAIQRAVELGHVAVVPGFIGRDDEGHTTLLGRGGSDLTALFIAQRLGAARCRLVKDVDGLYQADPARAPGDTPIRRYATIDWAGALLLGGGVVQDKAIHLARRHRLAFEVGAIEREDGTRVGDLPVTLDEPRGPGAPEAGLPPISSVRGLGEPDESIPNDGFRRIECVGAANR